VIGGSILLARRLARRISVPVEALQASAARLGVDGATVALPQSGMVEIDDVAAALEHAATRIGESVEQERAFSAEVSHQLRTPITGLRLLIETELLAPRSDPTVALRDAAVVVGRLETTVEELLSLARNRPTDRDVVDLDALLRDLDERWRPVFGNARRSLQIPTRPDDVCDVTVVASKSALGHIMDVLVDNALRHGVGEVTISRERIDGGVALRVADHGALSDKDTEAVFSRHAPNARHGQGDPPRHGIGLAMARRLAHAEGGELVCSSPAPTTFSVLLIGREEV
jgi:signal transduction histidine kinase